MHLLDLPQIAKLKLDDNFACSQPITVKLFFHMFHCFENRREISINENLFKKKTAKNKDRKQTSQFQKTDIPSQPSLSVK